MIGGVQFKIGDEWRMNTLTETSPEADLTQGLLAEMVAAGCTHAVVESTSHGLALHRLDHCDFDIGVFTGLSDDHLDFHGTRAEYLDAKLNLFRSLDTARDKGVAKRAVVRVDDAHRPAVAAATRAELVTVDPSGQAAQPADISLSDLDLRADGSRFRLATPAGALAVELALPARFNVGNAVARRGRRLRTRSGARRSCSGACATCRGSPGGWSGSKPGSPSASSSTPPPRPTPSAGCWASIRPLVQGRLIVVFGVAGERDPRTSRRHGRRRRPRSPTSPS